MKGPVEGPATRGELAAMLRAARAVAAVREPVRSQRFACAALAAACVATAVFSEQIVGFPHGSTVSAFLFARNGDLPRGNNEESEMSKLRSMVVGSALAIASVASAQNAVEWRVADGGNGHWYQLYRQSTPLGWHDAFNLAQAASSHLCTLTSAAEDAWVRSHIVAPGGIPSPQSGPWIGATCEGNKWGAWRWTTGETWSYTVWAGSEPNNGGGQEFYVQMYQGGNLDWNDNQEDGRGTEFSAVFEWSADCNNDGIVDYGQILAGALADANQNNIPDACEACGLSWAPSGDSLPVPTQADNWYGAGGQFIDANGDGIKDIVFACSPLQSRLGLGDGRFGPVIVSEPFGWFAGYCVADLNGDSLDDFVSYDYFAGRDRVMISLGDGRFAQSQALVTGSYAAPCRAADMDGDGDIDIVGGTEIEGYLRIFRNLGNGTFDTGVTIGNMGAYHREMELVDLDGDGDRDIVVQNEWVYQTIRILRNDGNMSFTQVATLAYPGGLLYLVPLDYDNDGDIDLIGSTILGDVRVYRKESKGFSFTTVTLGNYSNRALWLDLNDFDHDGIADLFLGDDNRFGFMRGRSTGGFETPVWISVPNKDRFFLVDLNGDGEMDVATGKQTPTSLGTIDFLVQTCRSMFVPQDFPTIQAAIDAVPAGAQRTVQVAAGTYHESFALNGKDVIVRGAANNTTILDGTGLTTSIARFTGGEPATAGVENLVFRNGIVGSRFTPKSTFTIGGALYGVNSAAAIRNCRFEQNIADFGGGVYLLRCAMNVVDSDFAGNTARDEGGGMQVYETTGVVSGCDFTQNLSGIAGPGSGSGFKAVGAHAAGETVLLTGCTFAGGISAVSGSAVEYYENTVSVPGILRLTGCTITGNSSGLNAGGLRVIGRMYSCVLTGGTAICSNTTSNVDGPYLIEGSVTVCDCLADFTHDGVVNGADLGNLLSNWGLTLPSGAGDVNHDGIVNGPDLAILLGSWGPCQ